MLWLCCGCVVVVVSVMLWLCFSRARGSFFVLTMNVKKELWLHGPRAPFCALSLVKCVCCLPCFYPIATLKLKLLGNKSVVCASGRFFRVGLFSGVFFLVLVCLCLCFLVLFYF